MPLYDDEANVFVDDRSVMAAIAGYEHALSQASMYEFLRNDAVDHLQRRAAERFAAEGDDASGVWAQLLDVTNDLRESQGFPREHPINERTSILRNWLTHNHGEVNVAGAKSASLMWPGQAYPEMERKFATAQVGRTTKPRTVARPVAAVDETDLEELLFAMRDFITDVAAAHMGSLGASIDLTNGI